jgi:hypothetical protein
MGFLVFIAANVSELQDFGGEAGGKETIWKTQA